MKAGPTASRENLTNGILHVQESWLPGWGKAGRLFAYVIGLRKRNDRTRGSYATSGGIRGKYLFLRSASV